MLEIFLGNDRFMHQQDHTARKDKEIPCLFKEIHEKFKTSSLPTGCPKKNVPVAFMLISHLNLNI